MFPIKATGPEPSNQVHRLKSQGAPIGGLNTRDALAVMPATDCPILVNWVPDVGGLQVRKGYREWALNFPSNNPVESVFSYFSATDSFPAGSFLTDPSAMPGVLFAATQDGIYDITTQTSVPTLSQALSDVVNAGWISTAMLANSAGAWLLACSETDGYMHFNGTVWDTTPGVTGVTETALVHVNVWKRRAWFVERDSTSVWYLAADAIAGAATELDVGPLLKKGGEVAFTASWTIDAGEGIDDFLVIVTTNGEVLVYKGTDPASITTFGLVGSWYVGQVPVGRRGHAQFGGDLVLLSSEGVFPISFVTRGGVEMLTAGSKEYSSKIRPSIGADLKSSFTIRGWQMLSHGGERLLIASVPDYDLTVNKQYAMNTSLAAWTIFADIPIYCMHAVASYALFGTKDGRVLLMNGNQDNVPFGASSGYEIGTQLQMPFNYFDTPAQDKIFHLARASVLTAVPFANRLTVATDFRYANLTVPLSPGLANATALWDADLWDNGVWDGSYGVRPILQSRWVSTPGVGSSGAAVLYANFQVPATLVSIDYLYEVGGAL